MLPNVVVMILHKYELHNFSSQNTGDWSTQYSLPCLTTGAKINTVNQWLWGGLCLGRHRIMGYAVNEPPRDLHATNICWAVVCNLLHALCVLSPWLSGGTEHRVWAPPVDQKPLFITRLVEFTWPLLFHVSWCFSVSGSTAKRWTKKPYRPFSDANCLCSH